MPAPVLPGPARVELHEFPALTVSATRRSAFSDPRRGNRTTQSGSHHSRWPGRNADTSHMGGASFGGRARETGSARGEDARSRPVVSAAYKARIEAPTGRSAAAASEPGPEERWERRPVLGAMVRLLTLAVPIAASVATAAVTSRVVPRPSALLGVLVWWVTIIVVSTLVLAAVDRCARRLLPLATLLRLSMVFPDHAPSRFSVAFRAGTTRNLREQLAHARKHGIDDEPARGAERILHLVAVLNVHDRGTRGHSERVRAFADLIAEELRLPSADQDRLRWAALLHDIGKLEIPGRVLNKPSRPNHAEWEALRRHPAEGARIATPLKGWLGPWAAAIDQHHERWDGTGYPAGLAGEDVNLGARIVAVADVFEVMTAKRSYRRPVSAQAARAELARYAGHQFDPEVVRALLNVSLGKLRKAMGPVSWLAQLPFLGAMPRLEGAAAAAGRSALTAASAATGVSAMAMVGMVAPPDGTHSGPGPGVAVTRPQLDTASHRSQPQLPSAAVERPVGSASAPTTVAAESPDTRREGGPPVSQPTPHAADGGKNSRGAKRSAVEVPAAALGAGPVEAHTQVGDGQEVDAQVKVSPPALPATPATLRSP